MPQSKKDKNRAALIWGGVITLGVLLMLRQRQQPDTPSGSGPRGLINKNPLNIIASNIQWEDKVPLAVNTEVQSGKFQPPMEQFFTMQGGYLATLKNLQSYLKISPMTLSEIVRMWASGNKNCNSAACNNYCPVCFQFFWGPSITAIRLYAA